MSHQITLYKQNNLASIKTYNQNTNYTKTNDPQEVIGRSLVNFKAHKPEPQETDRILLKNLVDILRFKEECDVDVLNTIYQKFLDENKIKSLDEIADDKYLDKQTDLLSLIADGCLLDEHEIMLTATEISNRLVHPEKYQNKKADIYSKDFAPMAAISQKYKMKNRDVKIAYEVLSTIARTNKLDSIFDIFNKDKNPNIYKDIELIKKYSEINDHENFIIDMGLMSNMSEYQRNIEVDSNGKWFKFLKNYKNNILASYICTIYNIEKHFTEVLSILNDRAAIELDEDFEDKASNAQIAYTIMDKYNLNIKAFNKIKEILAESNSDLPQLIEIAAISELIDNNYFKK